LAYYWLIGSNSKHVAGQRPEPSLNVVGTLNCPRIFIGIPGGKMSSQQASRSRRAQDIYSPIEEAHFSTTLVHLAMPRLSRTLYCVGKDLTCYLDWPAHHRPAASHHWRPQLTMRNLIRSFGKNHKCNYPSSLTEN